MNLGDGFDDAKFTESESNGPIDFIKSVGSNND